MSIRVTPIASANPSQWERVNALQNELQNIRDDGHHSEIKLQRAWWAAVKSEFRLSADHLKLLKRMEFTLSEGDCAHSVSADGNRPFGNGDWVEDIVEILGWTPVYDRSGDLDDGTYDRARRIMAELPFALNALIAKMEVTE